MCLRMTTSILLALNDKVSQLAVHFRHIAKTFSERAASQVLGQREPNDPRFMGQTISSNNKRKNPLPLDNTRSRPSPAEPGQPLPDQSVRFATLWLRSIGTTILIAYYA